MVLNMLKEYRYYTGIGSRLVTDNVIDKVSNIVKKLVEKDFILRSGGASGMDTIFEDAQDSFNGKKEIYLPWKNFNGNNSNLYNVSIESLKLAEKFHPYWNKCSSGAKKLHARSCEQILGQSLNIPSNLVVFWKNPNKIGGTDQALRIAKFYNIPYFNLYNDNEYEQCLSYISSI